MNQTKIRLTYYGVDGEGATVKEAKADAGRKIEALVKRSREEPRLVTIGDSAALYWHDESGWRVALAVVNGKPQNRLCAGYPGEPTEDEAMTKAARWVAEIAWTPDCADDEAFFAERLERFVGKRDLASHVRELASRAAWQRKAKAYLARGFTHNEAHSLASGYADVELLARAAS